MTANKRILLNTVASYLRSAASLFFGLWTSRWVLASLGEEDFGIYQMSGVCIVFFSFFNGVVSSSASRFFAYGLGKGSGEAKIWFSNAFWIHVAIAAAFLPLAGITGNWLFRHYFDIPDSRLAQAIFAFDTSLAATFASICAAPFLAMFMAKQEIFLQSLGIFAMSAAQCVAAWFLLRTDSDKLVFYAAVFATIHIAYPVGMSLLAIVRYPECRCFVSARRERLRELLGFSLWNALGPAGTMFKSQGNAVVVNKMLGVKRNAPIGICRQLSAQANALSQSLMTALLPEIATSAGAKNEARVRTLASNAAILSTLLFALIAVPVATEIEFFLDLWLKTPPPGTAELASGILFGGLVSKCASGQGLVLNAKGKIREYQLTVAPIVAGSVFVSFIGIYATRSLVWIAVAEVFSATGIAATGLYWGAKQAGLPVRDWVKTTLCPILKFTLPPAALGFALHFSPVHVNAAVKSLSVCTAIDIAICALAWKYALPTSIKGRIAAKLAKFRFSGAGGDPGKIPLGSTK